MRPILHFAPDHGWLNDPNGLVYWRGRHHLYYQYNPDSTAFTNQHWGHASSPDLVTWTDHPVALAPGAGADAPYDATACFSGCAVHDGDRVAILYTGVEGEMQLPCLAYGVGDELLTFVKDPDNPVIDHHPRPDVTIFRDHSVWHDGRFWHQAIAGATTAFGASVFGYTSTDLRRWVYAGLIADESMTSVPGPVWECPDVFRIDDVDVLVVSVITAPEQPGLETWWMTGALHDGRLQVAQTGPVDVGDRFYGPQSYWTGDGRRVMIGWLRTHHDPASAGAPSLGAMSLPRQLGVVDGRLSVEPVTELESLRTSCSDSVLGDGTETRVPAGQVTWGELVLDDPAAARVSSIRLQGTNGRLLVVDVAALAGADGPVRMFWDTGIVEVFRGGQAGAWTDLALGEVEAICLSHLPGAGGGVTVWELEKP